ncbi:DUF1569 domain-containing protein [Flavobacterium azooxidireducens]|uniref:DUF1569 domain-containing protein n=1 Tax=Flavobacterium azooxidireducens TaxID=1871076 RepID=A0ABY4KGE2_9FLAO|nr:DUF1569 domain-containing protein [Flavobacterium azooxidireducens]UPQ79440.1 DUF1569 domain-containing protein [Flavobacterium azooxidireducens]
MASIFDKNDNAVLISRINALTPETQPLWGKMNVGQMLSHCQAPIDVAFGDAKLKSNIIFLVLGRILKKKILAAPMFKKNSMTEPSFIRTGEYDFEETKAELITKVKRFADEGTACIKIEKHPFFGKMSFEEWDNLQWKHLNHHLKQFGV